MTILAGFMDAPTRYSWIGPDGIELSMSDPSRGWTDDAGDGFIVTGRTGFGVPPRSLAQFVVPGVDGATVRATQVGARAPMLKVTLSASSPRRLRDQMRRWALRLSAGAGSLLLRSPEGTRALDCQYSGGLELDETEIGAGTTFLDAVLTFTAPDPYFYAPDLSESIVWWPADQSTFLPILPITIARSQPNPTPSIVNVGDAPAPPVWTVVGPASKVILTDNTSGATWTWTGTLLAGHTLVVDMDPQVGTVTDAYDGSSLYSGLDSAATFWALPAGTVDVAVEIDGATTATMLTCAWTPRYLTA